jgi:hypothetical protein
MTLRATFECDLARQILGAYQEDGGVWADIERLNRGSSTSSILVSRSRVRWRAVQEGSARNAGDGS